MHATLSMVTKILDGRNCPLLVCASFEDAPVASVRSVSQLCSRAHACVRMHARAQRSTFLEKWSSLVTLSLLRLSRVEPVCHADRSALGRSRTAAFTQASAIPCSLPSSIPGSALGAGRPACALCPPTCEYSGIACPMLRQAAEDLEHPYVLSAPAGCATNKPA